MISVLLDGEKRTAFPFGLLETVGVHIGEKKDISDLLEEQII